MNIYRCCLLFMLCVSRSEGWGQFPECHDDFDLNPADGILEQKHSSFNWLGFIQYIHEELGIPHATMAPRVVLIHKQFVLATVKDVNNPPNKYKLNHIIFGQYEREETECNITQSQAKMGLTCGPAYIEITHGQSIIHPEYSRLKFHDAHYIEMHVEQSHAELQAGYMIPVCLPSLNERKKQQKLKTVMLIDYMSAAPTDFNRERMAKKTLKLLNRRECKKHRQDSKLGEEGLTSFLCTSGCGMRPGAPIISHALTGPFEIFGILVSSGLCKNSSMRTQLNKDPPLYIDIYPYVAWITNVITAHTVPYFYPIKTESADMQTASGRRLMPAGRPRETLRARTKQREDWVRRIYKVGNACFQSKSTQQKLSVFYIENFEVLAGNPSSLRVFIRISAGIECTIVCARISLPNRLTQPRVEGIGGYNITIEFTTEWFPVHYYFKVGLMGQNSTHQDFLEFLKEVPQPSYWHK